MPIRGTQAHEEELRQHPAAHKRLLRQAEAAAALGRLNICSIHEVAGTDGRGLLDMEYLEGPDLKQKIAKGPKDIKETPASQVFTSQLLSFAFDSLPALSYARDPPGWYP